MSLSSYSKHRPKADSSGKAFVASTQVRQLTLKFSDLALAKKSLGGRRRRRRRKPTPLQQCSPQDLHVAKGFGSIYSGAQGMIIALLPQTMQQQQKKDGMGAELTLGQTSAWIVTKSSRRTTCLERRQISLGLRGQELLKLKTCSREATPETEEITKEWTEVWLKHRHCSQAKAAILPTPHLCQSDTRLQLGVCSALSFHRKESRPVTMHH